MFQAGQNVSWPVKAQGVERTASGLVVVEVPAGGRPCDYWPKTKPKPEGRQLRQFNLPRDKPYVIVEETDKESGRVIFRTPPLHAPVTLATAKVFVPEKRKKLDQQRRLKKFI